MNYQLGNDKDRYKANIPLSDNIGRGHRLEQRDRHGYVIDEGIKRMGAILAQDIHLPTV